MSDQCILIAERLREAINKYSDIQLSDSIFDTFVNILSMYTLYALFGSN